MQEEYAAEVNPEDLKFLKETKIEKQKNAKSPADVPLWDHIQVKLLIFFSFVNLLTLIVCAALFRSRFLECVQPLNLNSTKMRKLVVLFVWPNRDAIIFSLTGAAAPITKRPF
jgi:hypothetical protein